MNPQHFHLLLDYMRGETITFDRIDDNEIKTIQGLFEYFNLEIGGTVSAPRLNERKRRTRSNELEDCFPSILPPNSPNEFASWVKGRVSESISVCLKFTQALDAAISEVEEKVKQLRELEARVQIHSEQQKNRVILDVGGEIFATCKDNFMKFPNSYFYGMFNSGVWKPDDEGKPST